MTEPVVPSSDVVAQLVAERLTVLDVQVEPGDVRLLRERVHTELVRALADDPRLASALESVSGRERYASERIDPFLLTNVTGRSVTILHEEDQIERFASRLAQSFGLSVTDAEFAAELACRRVAERVDKDPDLRARLISEPHLARSYVRTAVKHICIDLQQRSELRSRHSNQELASQLADNNSPDEDLHQRQKMNEALDSAIDMAGLTETERRRLELMRQNMSNVEIGRSEGVSETAVRKSVSNAINKIKAAIEETILF